MAFKMNNRHQPVMFPQKIDDYVPPDAPVRVYDAFVDALHFDGLGIDLQPNSNGGADEYYPKDMVKLLVFGPSYGFRSSRKLQRACHDNVAFMWLMGGLRPDYRTIARFRKVHKEALRKILKQCVRMCIKMDLIEGNILFTDGSKFRANASIHNTLTQKKCEERIKKIEKSIDRLLDECEAEDKAEENQESLVHLKDKIHDKAELIDKMKTVLKELEDSPNESVNTTDQDCVNGKSRQGTHAVYNMQSTTDEKNGLIVNVECVSQSNDYNQLNSQVRQAEETLGRKPEHVVSDSGYAAVKDLKKIDKEINVIVPSKKQAQEEKGLCPPGPFDRTHFTYDQKRDEYVCPKGARLKYIGCSEKTSQKFYKAQGNVCRACVHFGQCTKSRLGRKIVRLMDEEFKQALEKNYAKPENQKIYAMRKEKVEHPFGHMKKNLGAGQFLMRGREHVNAEASVLATCFNLARIMTIIGIPELIKRFSGL